MGRGEAESFENGLVFQRFAGAKRAVAPLARIVDMIGALARQSVIYAVATIVQRGAQMVTLLILPFFLSPSDYGAVQMVATVAILVNLLAPLEVTQGLIRYFSEANEGGKRRLANTAWWFTVATASVCLALGFAFESRLSGFILGDEGYVAAFQIGLVVIAFTPIFYFLQNQFRWQFDAAGYTWASIVFALGTMAGSIAGAMMISPAVEGVLVGQALGASVSVAFALFRLRRLFGPIFDGSKLRQMLAFSFPLVPAQLSLFAALYGSRIILNDLASLHEVGMFTFASQIATIATLTTIGINAALTPLVLAHYREPATPPMLARLFEGFTAVAIVFCLGLGLFAPELIVSLGNPSYADAGPLIIILAPALLLAQMYIFAPGFLIERKTSQQLWVSIASAVVGIVASYALVVRWGIYGAAVANLLASATFIGLWLVLTQRLYPVPLRWGRLGIAVAGGIVTGAVGMAVSGGDLSTSTILQKLGLIAAAGSVCFAVGLLPPPIPLLRAGLGHVRRFASQPGNG